MILFGAGFDIFPVPFFMTVAGGWSSFFMVVTFAMYSKKQRDSWLFRWTYARCSCIVIANAMVKCPRPPGWCEDGGSLGVAMPR